MAKSKTVFSFWSHLEEMQEIGHYSPIFQPNMKSRHTEILCISGLLKIENTIRVLATFKEKYYCIILDKIPQLT